MPTFTMLRFHILAINTMNLAQHLALFVKHCLQCDTVFTLTGGGAMFLNDAFGNTDDLKCIYTHHEQAAAMAALSYSKMTGIGVCITTTGCGATNAITGLLDAWQDSQPVLFISGQVKKRETTYFSGLNLRSFGVQEVDIVSIVSSITKKSICIGSKSEYFDILGSVHEWLFCSRPGPVWIDIPMDIQSQGLTSDEARTFLDGHVYNSTHTRSTNTNPDDIENVLQALHNAKQPIFLVGNGLRLSHKGQGIDVIEDFCRQYSIPIVSTYLATDFFSVTFPNYLGVVGLKAARRANIATYNADLIIVIGSRLATSVIGFDYDKFAPNAEIYIVDIDPIEHLKSTRKSMNFIHCDAYIFAKKISLHSLSVELTSARNAWLERCLKMKLLLPVQEQTSPIGAISIYDVVRHICQNSGDKDVLVSDAGSSYYVSSIMFTRNSSQRYITSGAQADMGFSLPAAIGVAATFLLTNARVHALTGDGSFQLNIQELQTLATNNLPVTVYVLNNNGYLSIRSTQTTFFPGRLCGVDPGSGVEFPDIRLLCQAYKLPYRYADSIKTLYSVVSESVTSSYPIVCEILCPENEAIIPRTSTIKRDDGSLESAPLCYMQPELSPSTRDALRIIGFDC